MGRKSTISRLPVEIRSEIDRLIREGALTIDEICDEIRGLGVDIPRSTLGDYKQKMEGQLRRYREAQEVAGRWVAELGAQKDSQLGQLLAELLKTVAFQTLVDVGEGEEGAKPMDVMLLAKALKDVAGAQKLDHEHRERLRDLWLQEQTARVTAAADVVAKEARRKGLSEEDAARLREHVLGVVG